MKKWHKNVHPSSTVCFNTVKKSFQSQLFKEKVQTRTMETKFQAIVDAENGTDSKATIPKKYEISPTHCQHGPRILEKIKDAYEKSSFGP